MRVNIEIDTGDRPPTHQEYAIIRDLLRIPESPEEGQPARLEDLPDNGPFMPVPNSTYAPSLTVQGTDMGEVLKTGSWPGLENKAAPSGS